MKYTTLFASTALLCLSLTGTARADDHGTPPVIHPPEHEQIVHETVVVIPDVMPEEAMHKNAAHENLPVPTREKPHWGYTGAGSAAYWASLDENFMTCGTGLAQSPVNIDQYAQVDLPDLQTIYQPSPLDIVNNGHTLQVNYAPGNVLNVDGQSYDLQQIHFHTPSEHYLDGAPYPMEAHFVHKAEDGTLAVLAVLMQVGEENPIIEGLWANAPVSEGRNADDTVAFNATSLLPMNLDYYGYTGSLTTPPCSEGVKWHVLKEPVEISQDQLVAFQTLFPVNARPIQPLNDRVLKGD